MTLTFSDSAKLLYPYFGREDNQAEFVITLTNNFMPVLERREKDGYIDPMKNRESRTVYSYFSGSRSIPPKAHKILGRSSKKEFEDFILSFTDNAQRSIADKLNEKGISSANLENVHKKCADIFQVILEYGKYEE
ncbi:MAG: hypothetical protein SOH93_03680 [Oscillospiraceae bacterium]